MSTEPDGSWKEQGAFSSVAGSIAFDSPHCVSTATRFVSSTPASSLFSAIADVAIFVPVLSARKVRNCDGNVHELVNGRRSDIAVVLFGAVDHVDGAAQPFPAYTEARARWDEAELVGQASAGLFVNFASSRKSKVDRLKPVLLKRPRRAGSQTRGSGGNGYVRTEVVVDGCRHCDVRHGGGCGFV